MMCDLCDVIPYYYGEIFEGYKYTLIRARRENPDTCMKVGEWGIVTVNSPFIVFKTTPILKGDEDFLRSQFENFCNDIYANMNFDSFYQFIKSVENVLDKEEDVFSDYFYYEKTLLALYCAIAKTVENSEPTKEDADYRLSDQVCNLDYDPKIMNV